MVTKSNVLIYENNHKIAHALDAEGYTLRPYNQYKPANTTWWLVPSSEWPAYRFGKYFVRLHPNDPDPMIGYYVEHGLPLSLKTLPGVKPKFIMQSNWYWHDFVRQMQEVSVSNAIRQTLESSALPVAIHLEIFPFNQVPDYEHPEESSGNELLEFHIESNDLQLQLVHAAQADFAPFNECRTIAELGQKLNDLGQLDFFWIDLYIGVRLSYGSAETGAWDAGMIWERILRPWKEFVK